MSTILLPTDFSENAMLAFPYASELAKRTNSKIVLLHVYDIALMAPSNMFTSRTATMEANEEEVRAAVLQSLRKLRGSLPADVPCEIVALHGNVQDELADYCRRHNVNWVVMSTQGASGLKELFLGSVAADVIRMVDCPVLAIPRTDIAPDFTHFVYATDRRHDDTTFLNTMRWLTEVYEGRLTILHVANDATQLKNHHPSLESWLAENERSHIKLVTVGAPTATEGIDAWLQNHKPDLLAVTTHTHTLSERLFHRSVTRETALHTTTPLLAFSQHEDEI